jgi:hypothetical protein
MFGTCGNYGVDNLALCLDEEDGTSRVVVYWKCLSMEKVLTKKGEEKKKLKLLHMQINSIEFIWYLKPKLQYFVGYNFIARWQDQQFGNCLQHFLDENMVSIIDFVENYSFKIENKVQSMSWHNYQCTILVHISWMRNPNPDPNDGTIELWTCFRFNAFTWLRFGSMSPPFSLYYTLDLFEGTKLRWIFFFGLPNRSFKIPKL